MPAVSQSLSAASALFPVMTVDLASSEATVEASVLFVYTSAQWAFGEGGTHVAKALKAARSDAAA